MEPIFETVLVTDGRIRLLDRHLARLARSGATAAQVEAAAAALARAELSDHVLRVDVTDSGVTATPRTPCGPTAVELVAVPGFDPTDASRETKRADRSWAAAAEHAAGPAEALLVSADGMVGETTRANVFCLIGDRLVTPPPQGILAGITRSWVIEQTGTLERPVSIEELDRAEAVFLTTAGRGVVPVVGRGARLVEDLAVRWRAL